MKFTTDPENAKIISTLSDMLSGMEVDQVVSYETIKAAIGFDVRDRRDLLTRARAQAETRTSNYFSAVRGIGIQRLHANYAGQVGGHAIRGIRRKASKAVKRISSGERSNNMSGDARELAVGKRIHLTLIKDMANNQRKDFSPIPPANHGPRSGFKG